MKHSLGSAAGAAGTVAAPTGAAPVTRSKSLAVALDGSGLLQSVAPSTMRPQDHAGTKDSTASGVIFWQGLEREEAMLLPAGRLKTSKIKLKRSSKRVTLTQCCREAIHMHRCDRCSHMAGNGARSKNTVKYESTAIITNNLQAIK